MGLHETTKRMREQLAAISVDLEKAANGNKTAAQRVRTGTIRLEKLAKLYRKESIAAENSGNWPKKPKHAQHKGAKAKQKAQPAKKASNQKKAAPKQNKSAKQSKLRARPRAKNLQNPKKQMIAKRATAKIPSRNM